MINALCQICGTYHDTSVCPQVTYTAEPRPTPQVGSVTFNGVSLGEQQIIDKLNEILKLLKDNA